MSSDAILQLILDLIRALPAALAVWVAPGYFWARCLSASADRATRIAYSMALSVTLVSAVALVPARLLGFGVTLPVTVLSLLLVFGTGLVAYRRFGPGKERDDEPLAPPPAPLGMPALAPLVAALGLMLGVALDLLPGQRYVLPVALALLLAGVFHLMTPNRETGPRERFGGHRLLAVARRIALPVVLLAVLVRAYIGPLVEDWPYLRGVDQYSHTVMANLMLSEGSYEAYLTYPPGFHTLTAMVSRLSGLGPLEIFTVLAPALLLLPPLALYTLARRMWGWGCGVAAAGLFGMLTGGSYLYFNDGMYPNLVASQFLMVLAVAALFRLYASPAVRPGLLLALLGSSVVLYHPVGSLYLASLLALVSAWFLPYLLLHDRRRGLALVLSLALLGVFSVVYAWDTYDLPATVAGLVGGPEAGATGEAVSAAIGTQAPYDLDELFLVMVSRPVLWLGLLGALFLVADRGNGAGLPYALARATVLVWFLLLLVGSQTNLSGFPQRFGRDLGVPLVLLAAFALVALLRSPGLRKPVTALAASLAVLLAATLIGLQAARNVEAAAGPSPQMTMTPGIAAAGRWLEEHNEGGNIMVSPEINQVPSRMMLAMGGYSALQSFSAPQILTPRDLPPHGPEPLWDVLRVMQNPGSERAQELLKEYDVRYVVLYKDMPDRPTAGYWRLFEGRTALYRKVFENEDVLIVARRESGGP